MRDTIADAIYAVAVRAASSKPIDEQQEAQDIIVTVRRAMMGDAAVQSLVSSITRVSEIDVQAAIRRGGGHERIFVRIDDEDAKDVLAAVLDAAGFTEGKQ
jgi:hypothetical protein